MRSFYAKLLMICSVMAAVTVHRAYSQNMVGVVGNTELYGVLYERDLFSHLGVKFVGLYIPGLNLGEDEYIYNVSSAGVFHFTAKRDRFDPFLMFGVNYSYHHWEIEKSRRSGELKDTTVGGGAGVGVAVTARVRLGLNVWINYDYRIIQTEYVKAKGGRFLLVIPIVDRCYSL